MTPPYNPHRRPLAKSSSRFLTMLTASHIVYSFHMHVFVGRLQCLRLAWLYSTSPAGTKKIIDSLKF